MKRGKAAGLDQITAEMLINLVEKGMSVLLHLYNKALHEGETPMDWRRGVIVPIYKKGDHKNCNNYRGITLLSIAAKVCERIIRGRLQSIHLDEAQCGFCKGRSTQDHIFSIKQAIEKCDRKGKIYYLAFIDLEKAFDSVAKKRIWKNLKVWGVGRQIRTAVQSLYENNKRRGNAQSGDFGVNDGLRQGGC